MTDETTTMTIGELEARERELFDNKSPGSSVSTEEWFGAYDALETAVRAAVAEGVNKGAEYAIKAFGAMPITEEERRACASVADYAVDCFRNRDSGGSMEIAAKVGAFVGEAVAEDELLRKLLAAWQLESVTFERGRPDGILGRAVDAAVDAIRPYGPQKRKSAPKPAPIRREG